MRAEAPNETSIEELKSTSHLEDLREEFGKLFTDQELASIEENPNSLAGILPPVFNRLSKEGKHGEITRLQELSTELVKEGHEESAEEAGKVKFPERSQISLMERLRRMPDAIKALGFVFVLGTSAAILENADSKARASTPEISTTEQAAKSGGKQKKVKDIGSGRKAICSETMCQIILTESSSSDRVRRDLESFLGEEIAEFQNLPQEQQEKHRPFLIETYNFIINQNPELRSTSGDIDELCKEIEKTLGS